jgi:hypothetical protein
VRRRQHDRTGPIADPLPHPHRGHLDPSWSTWFDNLTVTQADDGTTELAGPLIDQAALFGLLARLRDLGATLLLVERLAADTTQPES